MKYFVPVVRGLTLFALSIQGLADSLRMTRQLFVMFLSTRNQAIVYHVSLELRNIGIDNFMILSMLIKNLLTLFSYPYFAFNRSLGHEDSITSATVSVAAQKVTFSPSAGLLCLFESAEQMIRIAAESAKV